MVVRLDSNRHQALFEAELLTVQAVTMYVAVRARNAWHSTTSWLYRGVGSLTSTWDDAVRIAEDWRQRGSWFYIHEVPAILLGTSLGPIAIAEFHTKTSFRSWDRSAVQRVLRIGEPVDEAFHSLYVPWSMDWKDPRPSHHSFISGRPVWLAYDSVRPRHGFKTWCSNTRGGQYPLGWWEIDRNERAAASTAIVKAFREVNGTATVAEGEAQYHQAYDTWCQQAHAALTGDSEAYVHLLDIGSSVNQWRAPAIEYACRADVTAKTFQPAIECFLGELLEIGPPYDRRAPLRDEPGIFDRAVADIGAVLDTFWPEEAEWVRARFLLWGKPTSSPPLDDRWNVVARLRHPSRSQILRELVAI